MSNFSQNENRLDKSLILSRLKSVKNLATDTELAKMLGISKSTLSNWYSRNSIDYDLVFSICEHVNLNWLLTGDGSMFISDIPAPPPSQSIDDIKEIISFIKNLIRENDSLRHQILESQIKENHRLHKKNMQLHTELDRIKEKKQKKKSAKQKKEKKMSQMSTKEVCNKNISSSNIAAEPDVEYQK